MKLDIFVGNGVIFIIESGFYYDLYIWEIFVEIGLYVRKFIGIFFLKLKNSKVELIILYG